MNYYEKPEFKDIYLEDSYLIWLKLKQNELILGMDFVLCESHELYSKPKPDHQYCFMKGQLILRDFSALSFEGGEFRPSKDAENEIDYGSIHFLSIEHDEVVIGGEWGEIKVKNGTISIQYNER